MASRIGNWSVIQSSADPLSQDISIDGSATLFVLCVALYDTGAPAPTAVTLGGNALTLSSRVTTYAAEQTGIWYLANPPTGTRTLVFDHASAIDEGAHLFWAVFNAVDVAGTPVSSLGSVSSGSNNVTVSTPTAGTIATGDIAVGVGCVYGTDGVTLTGEILSSGVFNQNDASVGEITTPGAAVFTVTSGDFPAVSGIIIRNAAGGGGTVSTETLEDTLDISDQPLPYALLNRRQDDQIAVTEGDLVISATYAILVDDQLSVDDDVSHFFNRIRIAQSSIDISDEALSSIIGNVVLARILESAVALTDEVMTSALRGRIVQDAIVISEPGLETYINTNLLAEDSIALDDESLARLVFRRLLGDDLSISDETLASIIGQNVINRALTSEITTSDQAVFWLDRFAMGTSAVLTTDEIERVVLYTRQAVSALQLFDESVSQLQRFILLSEALSVEDSLSSLVTAPTTVSPAIVIGFDQPRIKLGGYAT